jgi:hypothetical protein
MLLEGEPVAAARDATAGVAAGPAHGTPCEIREAKEEGDWAALLALNGFAPSSC